MDDIVGCLDDEIVDKHGLTYIGNRSRAEDETVDTLLAKEKKTFGFRNEKSLVFGNWVKCVRLDAIAWILKTRALFGFGFQTAYLSIIYFDRFLSRRAITNEKVWAMKLLAVACLSIAAKMEELKVPSLSEFAMEDFIFETKLIRRMELLVLNTLDWSVASTTPFTFIPHFISKLTTESPPTTRLSQVLQLIWVLIRDKSTQYHRPSVVAAAAAILAAVDERLTRTAFEIKMSSISQCTYLEVEDVVSCYNLMQELRLEGECLKSPDLSPTQMKSIDCSGNSSVISPIASKRKRLNFSNCDEGKQRKI